MYTKTATAVLLALLGAAQSAVVPDSPALTKENYKEILKPKKFQCSGRTLYSPLKTTDPTPGGD